MSRQWRRPRAFHVKDPDIAESETCYLGVLLAFSCAGATLVAHGHFYLVLQLMCITIRIFLVKSFFVSG